MFLYVAVVNDYDVVQIVKGFWIRNRICPNPSISKNRIPIRVSRDRILTPDVQVLTSWLESGRAAEMQALDLDSSDNIRLTALHILGRCMFKVTVQHIVCKA